jgi:Major Facilitator Superfamily
VLGLTDDATQVDNQLAHRLIAVGRILLQRLFDQHPEADWRFGGERIGWLMNDVVQDVDVARAREWLPAGQRLAQHDPEGKDIAPGVQRPSHRLLWRHIGHCADDETGARQFGCRATSHTVSRRVAELRQAEVGELRVAASGDQNVVGLDVSVQDAGLMGRGECISYSEEQFRDLAPCARLSCDPVLLTTMAFGVLQNFAPAILSHVYGVSLIVASSGLTAYLVGSGTGMLAAGFLKDRADRIVAPALGFAAVMAAVLASDEMPSVALWPLMLGLGFGVGFAGPGRDLLVRRAATSRFGRSSFGRVYGFVYSGLDAGQAISPLVFGPVLDAGHFRRPLIAIALLRAAALLTALRVSSRVRSVEPHGVRTTPFDPETGRAQAP